MVAVLAPGAGIPPTPGFHPLLVPSGLPKMKIAWAGACFRVTGLTREVVKAVTPAGVSGATIPVGEPCPPVADGTLTKRPTWVAATPFVLLMEYSVEKPVALSLTQKGLVPVETSPQPLTRWKSFTVPPAPELVTRSVRGYCANVKQGSTAARARTASVLIAAFILVFPLKFTLCRSTACWWPCGLR